MEFRLLAGRTSGKTHYAWQYVMSAARTHVLETGTPFTALIVGFLPGQPGVDVKVTFEVVKRVP